MTAPAKAQIAAETDFALYVNGSRVPVTQFPDFEWEKTFSELDLSPHLHEGENTIAVLVWRLGMGNATHRLCPGGLLFALSAGGSVIRSDGSWKVRKSAGYRSGNCRFSSIPVGYRLNSMRKCGKTGRQQIMTIPAGNMRRNCPGRRLTAVGTE